MVRFAAIVGLEPIVGLGPIKGLGPTVGLEARKMGGRAMDSGRARGTSGISARALKAVVGVVVAIAFAVAPAAPAGAQIVDLSCGVTASTPNIGATQVSAEATNSCGRAQVQIQVHVCLLYNGVAVNCGSDSQSNSTSATARTSFPCVPGTWSTVAVGLSSNGKGSVAATIPTIVHVGECDPLQPRP